MIINKIFKTIQNIKNYAHNKNIIKRYGKKYRLDPSLHGKVNSENTNCAGYHDVNKMQTKQERPCHYKQLFVKSNGEVYPCCRIWNRKDMLIGHISDIDLIDKIKKLNPPACECKRFSIRKGDIGDQCKYFNLNVELSLACQARCAMCCVDAPSWKGTYNYYSDIEALIDKIGAIEKIVFQGGEVLIQKKSIELIKKIKNKLKNTEISVITNGNVDISMIEDIECYLDRVMISIVGFQSETYKKVMDIELDKTIKFAEKLIARNKIKVILKYLITPINYHEQNLFLKWALGLAPHEVVVCDSGWKSYINDKTDDNYWGKIIERTVGSVIFELVNCDVDKLKNHKTTLFLENISSYSIDYKFIAQNNLDGILKEYDT